MKNVRTKVFLFFTLILIYFWALSLINIYGGWDIYLINDDGSSPGSWNHVTNKLATATSLNDGPNSGNPGSFYYFRT
ncbi:MAG TPA: hypothetical protein PLL98_10295, partial [Bacillota bacterium]|nr:hypothetical protein [Bacillota bacterium]